jgi:hypothetical protein
MTVKTDRPYVEYVCMCLDDDDPWSKAAKESLRALLAEREECERQFQEQVSKVGHMLDRALTAEAARNAMKDALNWFVIRKSPIQAKFDLYGPEDTAMAMKVAFIAADATIDAARKGDGG